ncbi:hypothetical protein HN588_08350 [Candidatus Bathyarchaeota archaeon]|jgi:hypothetical protein|nr:hypothetical protein [Candidatus Bathyarchaeota archaeon]
MSTPEFWSDTREGYMDKKQKKSLKRAQKQKKRKEDSRQEQERVAGQLSMFERLPKSCSSCDCPFPKTRDAHMAWQVTVRTKEQLVRLFCPSCQELAKQIGGKKNTDEV